MPPVSSLPSSRNTPIKRLEDETFLSSDNVATYLNVSPDVVRMWRYRGTGPSYVKAAGKVLYREIDVIEFLNANIVIAETLARQRGRQPGDRRRRGGRKKAQPA